MASYPIDWSERTRRVRERDGGRCSICGRGNIVLQVHHIEPVSRGGSAEEANLLTVCEVCHRRLHAGSPGGAKTDLPPSSGFFCSNCDRFYSVDYGRAHGELCSVCGSHLIPWFTEKRD